MKTVRFYLGYLFGLMVFQNAVTQDVFIKNQSLFPAYPYNTTAYKRSSDNAFVGCGPTTGAMILAYFQASYSLIDLLSYPDPDPPVDKGLHTAWTLHGMAYMQTGNDGFGPAKFIAPGMENYASYKGYTLKTIVHLIADVDQHDARYIQDYGPFGDNWTNDGIFWVHDIINDTWSYDADKFCDFVDPYLSRGAAIWLSVDTDNNGYDDHWVPMVGYNRTTKKYYYYNTYDTDMHSGPIYYCGAAGHTAYSINMVRTIELILPQPDIASNPTTGALGSVNVGSYSDKTFVISNTGTANLSVTSNRIDPVNSEFKIISGEGLFTLAPGETRNITVRFSPISAGSKSASLRIRSNDPDENPFLINLIGTGTSGGIPDIASNPAGWDYGPVNVGSYLEKSFVISNEGNADLNISDTKIIGTNASMFSIQSGNGTHILPHGWTLTLPVRFTPSSAGGKSASLSIASNDPDENPILVNLSGTGVSGGASFNIVVDGNKDAFYSTLTSPDNGYIQLRYYAWNDNGKPANDADLSAKVWAAWDNQWFYLYEEVKDNTLSGSAANVWDNDCIELKIDPQATSEANSMWDTRLTALDMGGPTVVSADNMSSLQDAQKKWFRKTVAGGYVLEMAIQWSAILSGAETITPAAGNVFGLSINQQDNDGGAVRHATVQWGAVMLNEAWETPAYLGTIKFLAGNKLQFIARNNITGATNPVPYDGSDYTRTDGPAFSIAVDGTKDAFYNGLTGPGDGYLQLRYYAWNDNGKPVNDADLSAKIWTAWDAQWLYMYEEVKDNTVSGSAANVWEEDCVELKIDPQTTSETNSIWDTRLTALDMGNAGVVAADNMSLLQDSQKQWFRKTVAGGYVLELAVQWPAITSCSETITPAAGTVFGMGINQHDNDGGGVRRATLQWGAVLLDASWQTPIYLGTVKFLADHKLQFIAKNNITHVTNPVPYDGGNYDRTGVEEVSTTIPKAFALEQNYPNPFNPSTTVRYRVPERSSVVLMVCDMRGRRVRTLVKRTVGPGYYTIQWDARDEAGEAMPSGVYLCRLEIGGSTTGRSVSTLKMMLLR